MEARIFYDDFILDRRKNNNLISATGAVTVSKDFYVTEKEENTTFRTSNHPRSHSRSKSWSHHAVWLQNNSATTQNTDTMASIFSPIRVIQGIVPSLTENVSANNGTNGPRFPSSPAANRNVPLNSPSVSATEIIRSTTGSTSHHVRSRSDISRHSRQSSAVEIDMSEMENVPPSPGPQDTPAGNSRAQDHMEFYGTIAWMEKALPFILLLLSRIMWDHRLGILVFVGLFGTFFHVNGTIRKQVALKERRLNTISFGIFIFLFANTAFIYYVFNSHDLHYCLLLRKPNFTSMDLWTVFWVVGITDYVVRFATMALKCFIIILPRRLINFRKRGKYFLLVEYISQFYRMCIPVPQWYYFFSNYNPGGEYFAVISTALYFILKARMLFGKGKDILKALQCFWKDTRYGRSPSKEVLTELGDSCPICQEEMVDPIELNMCKHIFCEECIVMWFDRERTCPMCRAKVADDPLWRDGSTQSFIQLF